MDKIIVLLNYLMEASLGLLTWISGLKIIVAAVNIQCTDLQLNTARIFFLDAGRHVCMHACILACVAILILTTMITI